MVNRRLTQLSEPLGGGEALFPDDAVSVPLPSLTAPSKGRRLEVEAEARRRTGRQAILSPGPSKFGLWGVHARGGEEGCRPGLTKLPGQAQVLAPPSLRRPPACSSGLDASAVWPEKLCRPETAGVKVLTLWASLVCVRYQSPSPREPSSERAPVVAPTEPSRSSQWRSS